MRTVLFLIRDAAGWAGTERVLNLVAGALASSARIIVLSLAPERPCAYPYDPAVELRWLPLDGSILKDNARLRREIRNLDPDILVLTGIGEVKYLLMSLPGRRFKLWAWEHFNVVLTWRRLNRRIVARAADRIIALTERDAYDWRRFLSPRGEVVAMPNPVPSFPQSPAALSARRILAAGRLEAQKNFGLLIEAFALAAPSLPGWTLRIRGSGSEEEALRSAAARFGVAGRVELLPPTSDMASEYAGASLYAMSSRFEGFPMVLLEAMAAGLPCVSVDCPNGPREIIGDGEDGLVTPAGEARPLADALVRVASDAGLRARMGKAARRNVRRYAIEQVRERWLEALAAP